MYVNVAIVAQPDTSYIEVLPNDRTVQLHSTLKDVSLIARINDNEHTLFRNYNWSTGFYFKWRLAELYVAIPINALDNRVIGSPKVFGTGFGLNFYRNAFHFNYNFKYIQGFENFAQVWEDKLQTLTNHNYFIFNRLNTHYIHNPSFSLRAALRFSDRQVRSAGSLIIAAPISYHLGTVRDEGFEQFGGFSRGAVGLMAGYGYTYVLQKWSTTFIMKIGADARYSKISSTPDWELIPTVNIIGSTVYHWKSNFLGLIYNDYPEFFGRSGVSFKLVNWKLRIYAGKRFN